MSSSLLNLEYQDKTPGNPQEPRAFPTEINQHILTKITWRMSTTQTQKISIPWGIPLGNPHLTQGIPMTYLMSFLYLYSQWTRWDACHYWQTPYNRTEWHINTFCCSEPHSFVQCKVRKSSFSGVGYGNLGLCITCDQAFFFFLPKKQNTWSQVRLYLTMRVTRYLFCEVLCKNSRQWGPWNLT